MAMPKKFTPNQGQKEVLTVLAHCMTASDIESKVKGMGGFFKHFVEHVLDERQRGIWEAFKKESTKVRKDLAKMAAEKK